MTDMDNLKVALYLAEQLDCAVVPVIVVNRNGAATKIPVPSTGNGVTGASKDPAVIRAEWQRNPEALVGINVGMSRLILADGDVKPGLDGTKNREAAGWKLPKTVTTIKPNGSRHDWLRDPTPDVYKGPQNAYSPTGEKADKIPGFDRKSGNQLGVFYGDLEDLPDTRKGFAKAPDWLCRETRRSDRQDVETMPWKQLVATFEPGEPCRYTQALINRIIEDDALGHIGHGELMTHGTDAFKKGLAGHRGVPKALAELERRAREYFAIDRPSAAEGEINGVFEWVATAAQADVAQDDPCACELPLAAVDFSALEASIAKPEKVKPKKEKKPKKKRDVETEPEEENDEEEDANPIVLVSLSELRNRPRPQWFIDGIIQQGTVAVLGGQSGIGKTFLVLDMVGHMLHGIEWQGRKTRKGKVIYVAAEGVSSFGARIGAWEDFHQRPWPEENVAFVEAGVSMRDPESIKHLAQRLDEFKCDLLVLDTLSQLSNLNNENDNAEMAATIHVARLWQRRNPQSTVLLVHHVTKQTGNDSGGKLRGGGSLRANADTVIMAKRASTNDWFEVTTDAAEDGKQRDGAAVTITGLGLMDYAGSKIVHVIAGSTLQELKGRRVAAVDGVLQDKRPHGKADFIEGLIDADLLPYGADAAAIQPEWNAVRAILRDLVGKGNVIEEGDSARTKKWRWRETLTTLEMGDPS